MTLNLKIKNLIITIFLCFLCIELCLFILEYFEIINPRIAYAEEPPKTNLLNPTPINLNEHTTIKEVTKFIKTEVQALTNCIEFPKDPSGKPNVQYVAALSCKLFASQWDHDLCFLDLPEVLEKNEYQLKNISVVKTGKATTLYNKFINADMLECFQKLEEPHKNNSYAYHILSNSKESVIDNENTPHHQLVFQYSNEKNENLYQAHTITTKVQQSSSAVAVYHGSDAYHLGNSPLQELSPKECDSYVLATPKIYTSQDLISCKEKYFTQFLDLQQKTKKILLHGTDFDIKQLIEQNKKIFETLNILDLFPKNVKLSTVEQLEYFSKISQQELDLRLTDALTNFPTAQLTPTAEEKLENICELIKTQTNNPPLHKYTKLSIPGTPKNLGVNSHGISNFTINNIEFMVKTMHACKKSL